ncbi:hypothetical protein HanIR_Chr01g0041331 [Helianthus annuus]|nr:hypothetical protein HanIR_Chr01g0041331 [Helianthus annuus]
MLPVAPRDRDAWSCRDRTRCPCRDTRGSRNFSINRGLALEFWLQFDDKIRHIH